MVLLREEGNCQTALYCSLKNNQVISTALSFLSQSSPYTKSQISSQNDEHGSTESEKKECNMRGYYCKGTFGFYFSPQVIGDS